MRVVEFQGQVEPPDQASHAALSVLLVYEDSDTGLRAMHVLDNLPREVLPDQAITTRLWRCDLLRAGLLREQAAIEAAGSDVIVLSVHGGDELPLEVRQWLVRWGEQKEDRPYAMGVLLDARQGPDPIREYVENLVAGEEVDLFFGSHDAPVARPVPGSDTVQGATLPRQVLETRDLSRSGSYLHWGLNE
jgi:hypothetical protein